LPVITVSHMMPKNLADVTCVTHTLGKTHKGDVMLNLLRSG